MRKRHLPHLAVPGRLVACGAVAAALIISAQTACQTRWPAPRRQCRRSRLSTADPASRDRSAAYFHAALANMYEEQAINSGRPEFVQHAIEEFKAAINADPHSPQLYDGLAELYFRTGRARDAEATVARNC